MRLYKLISGTLLELNGTYFLGPELDWDQLLGREQLPKLLASEASHWEKVGFDKAKECIAEGLLAPMGTQEVWAAGVTYFRSRTARMEESSDAGGATFYDKVYVAERPELFFKATASRVSNPGDLVKIRTDSSWDVPEPELTLLLSPSGKIQGYTIGNDMSSRSIEGENPLYLPQAKVYQGCASLGPCLLIQEEPLPASTKISLEVRRQGSLAASGETTLAQLKRSPEELAQWLFRANSFPNGCFLMTGTGIVPDNFSLVKGDSVTINMEGIGTLQNGVGTI
ncbi:MAG: fumarylacetoacetate hydrolase family protein [Algoriphagus sp.]